MSTGYTHAVEESDDYTFEEFLWHCAAAFFYDCTEPPEERKPSEYEENSLLEAKKRLAELQAMSPEEAETTAREEYESGVKMAREAEEHRRKKLARYDAMRAKVLAWVPPLQAHKDGLQRFMLEQIDSSIEFMGGREGRPDNWKPVRRTGKQWLKKRIEDAKENVVYCVTRWAEEQKRAEETNLWLKTLEASVPRPRPKKDGAKKSGRK
jgi:hypothetical protein